MVQFAHGPEVSTILEADMLNAVICFDVGFQFMEPRPGPKLERVLRPCDGLFELL